jgi:hypothetical protein
VLRVRIKREGEQMFEMWVCVLPHSCCLSCVRVCLPARACPAYLCLMQVLGQATCVCPRAYMHPPLGVRVCDHGYPHGVLRRCFTVVLGLRNFCQKLKPLQNDLQRLYSSSTVSIYQGAVRRISGRLTEVSDGPSV